jgi:hypothetical protein
VPRLDAPARLLLGLPAHQARWLLGGVLPALVVAGVWGQGAWGDLRFWLGLLAGVAVGCVGAFVRPHGRHLGQWAGALVGYLVTPRRAVWRPAGRKLWTW